MEVEKRKKRTNDVVEVAKKKVKAVEDDLKSNNNPAAAEVVVPEEEEVEEFFAILRRIHVAVKYFGKVNGDSSGRKAAATARPWNPSFRREDFEEKAEIETVLENTGLDLNAEPCSPGREPF